MTLFFPVEESGWEVESGGASQPEHAAEAGAFARRLDRSQRLQGRRGAPGSLTPSGFAPFKRHL